MKFLFSLLLLTARLSGVTFPSVFNLSFINSLYNQPGFFSTTNFQYAMDPSGNVVAVWLIFNGNTSVIQAAYKPFGAHWILPGNPSIPPPNPPITPPPLPGTFQAGTLSTFINDVIDFDLQMDLVGNTVVVWRIQSSINPGIIAVQTAYKPAGGANWQIPLDPYLDSVVTNGDGTTNWGDNLVPISTFTTVPSTTPINSLPAIAIAGGNVVIAWSVNAGLFTFPFSTGVNSIAQVGFKPAASFTAANPVDNGYNVITVSPNDTAPTANSPNGNPAVVSLNAPPAVAVDAAGNAVITWQAVPLFVAQPNSIAQAIYKPVVPVTTINNFNPQDATTLSYGLTPTPLNVTSTATSPPSQTNQYQQLLNPLNPVVSPPPQTSIFSGNAVVMWAETDGSNNFIEAAYNKGGAGWHIPTITILAPNKNPL